MQYTLQTLGVVHSCYKEKFGIPRQPGLVSAAWGVIEIAADYARAEAFAGLENCSHIWVEFIFHAGFSQRDSNRSWQSTVRPPRLGGNQRVGVFATRSPNRPNKLGLSVVKLERIEINDKGIFLHISGHDFLHGTPVVDIKPYVAYVDSLPQAVTGFADCRPATLPVDFADEVKGLIMELPELEGMALLQLIRQVLQQDPRPAYQTLDEQRVYGTCLSGGQSDWNVQWRYQRVTQGDLSTGETRIDVCELTRL